MHCRVCGINKASNPLWHPHYACGLQPSVYNQTFQKRSFKSGTATYDIHGLLVVSKQLYKAQSAA